MDLVRKIIKHKTSCIIISPHCDDAILSCGELLLQLNKKTKVTIINVFTAAHGKPYTLSEKQFLKTSGYTDAETLYKERQNEDKKVVSTFSVSIINLGLEDALFRRKKQKTFLGKFLPDFDHLYPTYRWHIIKKIEKNDYTILELKKKLKMFKNKNTLVFAPYGIGNHVDHVIARKVCEELFENLILYSDFPYNVNESIDNKRFNKEKIYTLQPDRNKKDKLIKGYITQFHGLFPTGTIPVHSEIYYSKS